MTDKIIFDKSFKSFKITSEKFEVNDCSDIIDADNTTLNGKVLSATYKSLDENLFEIKINCFMKISSNSSLCFYEMKTLTIFNISDLLNYIDSEDPSKFKSSDLESLFHFNFSRIAFAYTRGAFTHLIQNTLFKNVELGNIELS